MFYKNRFRKIAISACLTLFCVSPIFADDIEPNSLDATNGKTSVEYAQSIYQLMLAEMAISREEYNNALALYINLARNTHNEEVIKNAISLAVSLKAESVTNHLIDDWIKKAPDSISAKVFKVRVLMIKGKLSQAEDLLNKIPPNKEYNDEITYLKSLILLELKDTQQALGLLETLNHSKYESDASFFSAQIYDMQNKTDLAIIWYSKVTDGKYVFQSNIRLAILLLQKGLVAKALSTVIYLKPENKKEAITKITVQADLELMLSKNKASVITLTKGLSLVPHNSGFLYMRGLAYANLGQLSLAQVDFEEVLAKEPNNAEVLNALGYAIANNSNRYQQAYDMISKALKITPDSPAIMDSMGWVLFKLGRYKEALIYLKKSYAAVPEGEIGAHYAVVLNKLGDIKSSKKIINQIRSLQPSNKHAIDILKENNIDLNES
ncbi:MAG: tetratricopeptide (TPR) repeat protein [Francisellaceae bacterium]|jgi:tetratricopeptide (TPR) repeat protein